MIGQSFILAATAVKKAAQGNVCVGRHLLLATLSPRFMPSKTVIMPSFPFDSKERLSIHIRRFGKSCRGFALTIWRAKLPPVLRLIE